jgi:hypothetical protein
MTGALSIILDVAAWALPKRRGPWELEARNRCGHERHLLCLEAFTCLRLRCRSCCHGCVEVHDAMYGARCSVVDDLQCMVPGLFWDGFERMLYVQYVGVVV